ncbi:MAG TPA: CDP-alcohol phosphatidyltransferase family protein [Actinomycetota bacterium]
MKGDGRGTGATEASSAIATVPNALSLARILLIPSFVWLIVDRDTTFVGLVLFGVVVSTDWVDGALARRTGRVSELGKILDPTADRLAIAAGLVALVIRGAFPLWAALLILVRDALVLGAGLVLLGTRHVRIEVRTVGKVATFGLMMAIGAVSWGTLGYPFHAGFLALGWTFFGVGIVEYYVATALYAGDVRGALARPG